jgi:Fe-S-cluster containining protein
MKTAYEQGREIVGAVPCNGCRACCINQRIVLDDDEITNYITIPTARGEGPVVHMLAHKPDTGECVYLGETGCIIHDRAPRACKHFDCRVWLKKFSPAALEAMKNDGLDGDVVRAALERVS